MNESHPLFRDILMDESLGGFRQESLEKGLAALRAERRRRAKGRRASVGLLALAAVFGVFLLARVQQRPVPTVAVAKPGIAPRRSEIRFISDDELLAMFPRGSAALIGAPGKQQLVFLGEFRKEDGTP